MALSRRTGQRFQASIWPGFVDAMTGLLLVLMFVLTIFMVVQFVLRETISGQETELDALSAEVAALAQALGLEQRRSAGLESRVGEPTSTIETARDEADRQASLIASLTSERNAQAAALTDAKSRIASFEEQVAGLLAAQKADRETIAGLETRQTEILSEQEALNLALAQARDEIDAGAEAARLAAAKREALEALLADLRTEKAGLETQLSDTEAGRLAEAAAAEALREKLKNADAELTAMTLALEEQRKKAEETLTLLAAAEKAGDDLELRLAAALLAGEENQTAFNSASEESAGRAARIAELEALLGMAEADGEAARGQVATLETRLATLEMALNDTKAQAQGLETLLASRSASLDERQAETDALKARLALLETALGDEKDRASGLESDLAAQKSNFEDRLAAAEAALAEKQAALSDKTGEAASLAAQVATLEAALAKNRTRAEGLAAQLEAERAGLEARLAAAEAALGEAHDTAADERKSFEDRLAAAQAALARSQDSNRNLIDTRTELEKRLAAAEAALDAAREADTAERRSFEERLAAAEAALAAARDTGAGLEADKAGLEQRLAEAEAALAEAKRQAGAAADALEAEKADLETRLARALARLEAAEGAGVDRDELRERLRAALAAKLAAEQDRQRVMTESETRAALLSAARDEIASQSDANAEAARQQALLNQQVAALRSQLGSLQALLDDYKERDTVAKVQLQSLGTDLNTALARAAAEERKRRQLEEAEAKRLAEEKARLEAEKKDLEKYKSEFFGRLRDVLGNREGVQVVGDRFVFSSEVLFPPGEAALSEGGQAQIARVAGLLAEVAADIPAGIDWVIQVDGHTDNTPLSGFGEFRDNWELSQARALSVVRYMVDELGLPPYRLSANGFGEFQPVAQGDSDEARAQNRRIELKLTER